MMFQGQENATLARPRQGSQPLAGGKRSATPGYGHPIKCTPAGCERAGTSPRCEHQLWFLTGGALRDPRLMAFMPPAWAGNGEQPGSAAYPLNLIALITRVSGF